MSMMDGAPKEPFRLSMLIYDARYRAITIQIAVLILFLLGFFWLANNAVQNLADLGKPIRFGFLNDTAGYDINQKLVEYSSQSTHLRATFVGLLNTLLVAVMGCFAATILGVVGGVLRLSKNWLISSLMTLYVEIFRNVPVLLWIFVCMFSFTAIAPHPNTYRGENAESAMLFNDSVALTNRGIYMPEPLFSRPFGDIDLGIFDVSLEFLAVLIAASLGIFFVGKNNKKATRIQALTGRRPRTAWSNAALVLLPPLIVLVIAGFYLGKPVLSGFNFKGGINMSASLIGLWLGLTLYTTTYIIEAVRSGIEAVNKGQSEAAYALGLRPSRTMNLIVLPQAMRIIIPQLISQYLNLTKNSSLALAVGYMDLVSTLGGITLNQSGREMESILLLMAIYLTLSLIISGSMNWYNNRMKLVER
jgi:general L-amino acid transport system permease protein